MRASLFFLFNHGGELYIVDNNHVQNVPKPRELIRRFSQIEAIRDHALHLGLPIVKDSARERTKKHTAEGIERIRQAKLGDNHPSRIHGVSPEHREKTSRTMTGTRRGENNPMWRRSHTKETRIKMSEAAVFKERRRWVVSPEGNTTTIPVSEPRPEGWQWGRFYDPYKPDTDPFKV
mgnify:FL=1|tara:strand:- start:2603 stop:3133 length:531 start_codon:yes stop_codon:yes gene_type:complete